MELDYRLFDPTGNRTILVETPVPAAEQPRMARALMAREKSAEQVGFVSAGDAACDLALRMAGGEFCGNAAMCAAALHALRAEMACTAVRVRVSGAQAPVCVETVRCAPAQWRCRLALGGAKHIETVSLPLGAQCVSLPLVWMEGIAHLICTQTLPRETAEAAVKDWCAMLGAPALGLIQRSPDGSALTPLVYVPAADTLFWENSCASGTVACAAYLAQGAQAPRSFRFSEPGGTLLAAVQTDGSVLLQGEVRLEKTDRIQLD